MGGGVNKARCGTLDIFEGWELSERGSGPKQADELFLPGIIEAFAGCGFKI